MTKVKKTALSLAMAAVMGGAVSSAQAVNLAADGLGDVLLFPYYTVRNDWNTLIHITNTSSVATVAVKVRFQEAWNTRDVLDFILVLSPNDVWTGYVAETAAGPRLKKSSDEDSCTSPIMSGGGFTFLEKIEDADVDRAREGHVTIIEMGHALAGTAIDAAAKAKNCAAIDTAFRRANIDATSNQFGEPINSLKGQFSLVQVNSGLAMGGDPVTLANFFSPTVNYATNAGIDGAVGAALGGFAANFGVTNLIAAQQYPDFLLPTLNDANPPASLVQDDIQLGAQRTRVDTWNPARSVDAVSAVLMRSNVINEWSINPDLGVESYWVVSFPTKFHYVDTNAQPTTAEIAQIGAGRPAYVGGPSPFSATFGASRSCDPVVFNLWDRSEGGVITDGTSVSPAPPQQPSSICNEVNVLTFSSEANVLASKVAQSVDIGRLTSGQPFGWLNVALPNGAGNRLTGSANTYVGLPVTGFTLWSRDFGVAANNYGHLVDHAFRRTITP